MYIVRFRCHYEFTNKLVKFILNLYNLTTTSIIKTLLIYAITVRNNNFIRILFQFREGKQVKAMAMHKLII